MANFDVIPGTDGVHIKHWTRGVEFEEEARKQLLNVAKMPFTYHHVAIMPDVHAGRGCSVGSVIATRGAIIPANVGVDIGCGMIAVKTNITASDLPESLGEMRSAIEKAVPHGGPGLEGSWKDKTPPYVLSRLGTDQGSLGHRYRLLALKHPQIESSFVTQQFGTLGTGNHFVEVCLEVGTARDPDVWVMLHSGSRGPGNRIGQYFIEKAKEEMRRWFINLPDQDLAYLPENSELFHDYMEAIDWAQEYAMDSRWLMLGATLKAISDTVGRPVDAVKKAINCHHNYVSREHHFGENVLVTRKGAVRARKDDLGIIPGSMGARSYIVRGLGNPESFQSCSHGAGRKMSRGAAKKAFSLADHAKATQGVECRKDLDVVDETPGAYKDVDKVMAAQNDLVEVVTTIKQVLCVKG